MTERHPRIFLAHAQADLGFAERLARKLSESGAHTFGVAGFHVGEGSTDSIEHEIETADIVVFVVPSREGEGRSALAELGAARALGKRIVSIVPDSSRFGNSDAARRLSEDGLIDASRQPDDAVAQMIMAAA